MCDYLSAIGMLDGDVYHQDGVDRHSELSIKLANSYNKSAQHIAENSFELEFKPSEGINLGQIKEYQLNWERFESMRDFDGKSPLSNAQIVWGLEKCKDVWRAKLSEIARSKIIKTGHIEILPPGDWVLCGDVIVQSVTEHSRVIALLDDAQIRDYARNAEITVYDRNASPGFKNIPSDYYSHSAHQEIAKKVDALRAIKDPKFFFENNFDFDLAKRANWMKVKVYGNFTA